jgi:streptogramin lyase
MARLLNARSRKWSSLAAVVGCACMAACGNGAGETAAAAAEMEPQPESAAAAAKTAGPPLGPSLWIVIDRGPVAGDPELVQAIARLDPSTGEELDRIVEIGYNPSELTYADGTLCVHNIGYSSITCVDAATHEIVRTHEFGNGFTGYGRIEGALWATEMVEGLSRIDPATGARTHLTADVEPKRFSSTDGAIWVLNSTGGIRRLDPGSGATVATIPPMFDDDLFMTSISPRPRTPCG